MARTTPTTEPQTLIAGDSWSWTKSLSTYPPSEGWTLGYSIRGASTLADANVITSVNAGNYSVSVDKSFTAPLAEGAYKWQSYVVGSGVYAGLRYTVETGVFMVIAALSSLTGAQGQTHVERTLAKIESEIEARISGTGSSNESYSINGRAISKIHINELVRLRSIYADKVRRLDNPGQLFTPVLAVMANPDGAIGTAAPTVLPPWYRWFTQ